MKKILYFVFAVVGLAGLGACDGDKYVTENNYYVIGDTTKQKSDTTQTADNSLDSTGTATRPTDWTVISNPDPTKYMVVRMDSTGTPAAINSNDILAAFAGKECRGIAYPETCIDGVVRYNLLISRSSDESDEITSVVLRYYSETKHRVYVSDAIDFSPGDIRGSLEVGLKPTWK